MIDSSLVTDAVLVVLRAAWPDGVGDCDKPVGVTGAYGVLEHPPGPGTDRGDMADGARHLVYRCRLRSVGGDRQPPATAAGAREQAELLAYRLRAALLDHSVPIEGPGWKVTSRVWTASGGVDVEGTVANAVDEVELLVVPA